MKIKKQLQQQNNKINEDILQDGQDLYDSLATQYCQAPAEQAVKPQSNKFKLRLAVVLSCVLVVVLAVGITWILYPSQQTEYLTQNENVIDCSLEDVYTDTHNGVKINVTDHLIKRATKTYDAPSNDTLYYTLSFESKQGFASGHVYIVVNNNYTFMPKYDELPLQDTISGYDINYTRQSEDIGGAYICEYFGCITLPNYKIYFLFEDVVEQIDSSPTAVLCSLFTEIK